MRTLLLVLALGLPAVMAAQAPRCEPTRPLMVDTSHAVLGVRARLASDSLEDSLLTRRLGAAMVAIPFRAPGTISRVFYPGTGGGPKVAADLAVSTRLVTQIRVDPLPAPTASWSYTLAIESEDPITDTAFTVALREAVPWVLPGTTAAAAPWVAELVVAAPGDPTVHPLARLTIPAIRLDQPAELTRAPRPNYPQEHRELGQGGVVRAQYVIDEQGRAEPASLRILSAPSLPFAESAKVVLLAAEYTPAMAAGCPQKQLVQQTVRFAITARVVRVQ